MKQTVRFLLALPSILILLAAMTVSILLETLFALTGNLADRALELISDWCGQ